MKKTLSLLLALLMITVVFAGCGGASQTPDNSGASDSKSGEAPSVILLIPGSLGDKSFFDSANNGLKLVENAYGCKTKVIEMSTDTSKFIPTFEDVIDEGWDIIITGGINVAQPMTEVAAKYPNQKFMLYDEAVDYTDGKNANVYTMTYKAYEGAYLAGALAGLVTKSDMPGANPDSIIGFAGGFDIPLINDWLVGYIAGAQRVNPDVKVGIGYINSFTDAAKGKEIGMGLINSGIDIMLQAAGGAGLGVLDAASEMGVYAIGSDSDQAEMFSGDEAKANAILASVLKRVDSSIEMAVGQHIDGTLPYGATGVYGIAEGCIEITDNQWYNNNVPQDIRNEIASLQQKLGSGEIVVKSAFEMSDDELAQIKNSVTI